MDYLHISYQLGCLFYNLVIPSFHISRPQTIYGGLSCVVIHLRPCVSCYQTFCQYFHLPYSCMFSSSDYAFDLLITFHWHDLSAITYDSMLIFRWPGNKFRPNENCIYLRQLSTSYKLCLNLPIQFPKCINE